MPHRSSASHNETYSSSYAAPQSDVPREEQEVEDAALPLSPELLRAIEAMQAQQRMANFAHLQRFGKGNGVAAGSTELEAIAQLKQRHAEYLEEIERRFYAQVMQSTGADTAPRAGKWNEEDEDVERDAEREEENEEDDQEEEEEEEADAVAEEAEESLEEAREAKYDDSDAEEKASHHRPPLQPRTRRQSSDAEEGDDAFDSPVDRRRQESQAASPRSHRSRTPPLSARSDLTAYTSPPQHRTPSSGSRTAHSTANSPRRASHVDSLQLHHPETSDAALAEEEEENVSQPARDRQRVPASPYVPYSRPPRAPQRPSTAGPFKVSARDAYDKWSRPLVLHTADDEECEHFRAKELPVHILGSQYEDLRQAREQRSKERKRAERHRLYESIRPFEFAASTQLRRRREKGDEEEKEPNDEDDNRRLSRRSDSDSDSEQQSTRSKAGRRHVAFGMTTAGNATEVRPSTAPVGRDGRFVARDVPYNCSIPLLDTVVKREEERRAEVRRQRAAYLASIASMPPRMALHQAQKAEEAQRRAAEEQRRARHQREAHRRRREETQRSEDDGDLPLIPDFSRLHSEFARSLQKKKEEKPSTTPRAFRFRHTERVLGRHRSKKEAAEEERAQRERERRELQEEERQRRELRRRRAMEKFGVAAVPGTKALTSASTARSEATGPSAAGGAEEDGRVKAELRAALAGHWSVQERTAERIKRQAMEGRRAQKESEERWKEQVQRMKHKVQQRPLLLHGHTKKEEEKEQERRNTLVSIQRTLDKAGVVDQSEYFAPEELELLDAPHEEL